MSRGVCFFLVCNLQLQRRSFLVLALLGVSCNRSLQGSSGRSGFLGSWSLGTELGLELGLRSTCYGEEESLGSGAWVFKEFVGGIREVGRG